MSKTTRFILYSVGIFVTYFCFGIIQEKITRGKYTYEVTNEEGVKTTVSEQYKYALALAFIQCFINYLFAKGMLFYWPNSEDRTPLYYYASSALTYLLAMVCSNMALQWVPYPVQVVGKSAKPIPVMILGVIIGRKSYPLRKYFFVFLIVIGVTLFMYKEQDNVKKTNDTIFGLGELLLILSLSMDGLTAAIQERMRADSRPTGKQLMLGMNFWASVFLATTLILSGEIFKFLDFVSRHPFIIGNIATFAFLSAFGQLFILLMVSEFGPLPCAIVTTTRKFFTVLASVIIFGNSVTIRQWISAILVFVGVFMDGYFGKATTKKI